MAPGGEDHNPVDERLDRLKVVIDAALSFLDVDELLVELLERVVELLEADTAAVLLVDATGRELYARAARGLEDEVRQGVRIPIGRGFAGRVAAEARPIILDRVDETTVANPILWEAEIQAMLGVPLLSGGSLIGVLHVGTVGDRRFNDDDIALLQVVAERMAGAVHVRTLEAEREAAEALQRSLLPSAPPKLAALEFASRYVPAGRGGVGGDWYDVFQLDSGEVWIVTGDVVGHGLQAAVVMGRLRSALRAYALLGVPPDEVVALTDRKVQHFEVGQMATCAVAVVPPPYEEANLVLAGHPPVILAAPGAPATFVEGPAGLPLGIGIERSWPVTTVPLTPGSLLFFYTDGLVERRYEDIDSGLERLRQAVTADHPEAVCHRVMAALVGGRETPDDIAVLAVRRSTDPRGGAAEDGPQGSSVPGA